MKTASDDPKRLVVLAVREELCLDYANTLMWRGTAEPSESLHGYDDLIDWLARAAELPADIAAAAREAALANPARAQTLFLEAIAGREAICGIFSAIADGRPVPEDDLGLLNQMLAVAPPRRQLDRLNAGFGWQIAAGELGGPGLLAPVLWSAAELLLAAGHRRIRRCANEQCLWLFVDASKGGTRRWCDMSSCGNRAKARRHYSKIKAR